MDSDFDSFFYFVICIKSFSFISLYISYSNWKTINGSLFLHVKNFYCLSRHFLDQSLKVLKGHLHLNSCPLDSFPRLVHLRQILPHLRRHTLSTKSHHLCCTSSRFQNRGLFQKSILPLVSQCILLDSTLD